MYSANHWGGTFEIHGDSPTDDDQSRNMDLDRSALSQQLSETQQSWLLGHGDEREKKSKYIDLGCIICSRKVFKWTLWTSLFVVLIVVLPTVIVKTLPKHTSPPPPPDNYTIALHKALLFFNAQKSGKLPVNNGIPWRGNSGLSDGSDVSEIKGGLVGGYYDAGDNIKFHFPLSFSMTMLSWTVVEYSQKYKAIGEYDHVRDIIKWGTDYLLKTFNSSASTIDHLYAQVGSATNGSTTPDDHYCWERPENMDYPRQTLRTRGADISGEMAAALAAASIVFRDDPSYSKILVDGAATLFKFARSNGNRGTYSKGNPLIDLFYNSTGYYDEYMWGAAWLYYATGNSSYLNLATNPGIPRNAHAFRGIVDLNVLSWDNKLPAAMLLLTRMRIFLNPGYPYEEMLRAYYNSTGLTMCSYLQQFNVFNFTKGGMIELNHGRPQPLQYVANAAFLAKLYADYMNATGVPGWWCGPKYFSADVLIRFAQTQINYILGSNPKNMSYLVGYGSNYPKHVHHRGASTPNNGVKYSCTGGWKWRDAKTPNPNVINGAMVGGPDRFDGFLDVRGNYSYTEPTMAGNAGLVAALIALTASGDTVIDRNTIFSAVPPLFPPSPPPPPPWKP